MLIILIHINLYYNAIFDSENYLYSEFFTKYLSLSLLLCKHDLSVRYPKIYRWQDLWSTIDFSRSRSSLLNLKQQPTSLRHECPAGSGILQVNYSLEWVARRGVGWHAHHWGTPAPRRHLSPYASNARVKLRGTYVHTYVNTFACMYVRCNSRHKSLSSAWRFAKPSIFATPMIIK